MKKLSIAIATRGRPELLTRTLNLTLQHMMNPNTRILVCADDDDHATIDTVWKRADCGPDDTVVLDVRPREPGFGAKFNRVITALPADVYLTQVDYAPHVTYGFDSKILDAASTYPDGIAIVYNDIIERLPAINAVTARFVKLNDNQIYAPWFPYGSVDLWLDDIAQACGRIAYCEVTLDRSKRPGTQNKYNQRFWNSFYNVMLPVRVGIAFRIIEAMDGPDWYKDGLRRTVKMRMQWVMRHNDRANLNMAMIDPIFNRPMKYDKFEEPDLALHARAQTDAIKELDRLCKLGIINRHEQKS